MELIMYSLHIYFKQTVNVRSRLSVRLNVSVKKTLSGFRLRMFSGSQ